MKAPLADGKQAAKPERAAEPARSERGATNVAAATALRLAAGDPRAAGPNGILSLQRAIGNRAVQRLLNVNKPDDPFEHQADEVAAAVRGHGAPAARSASAGGSGLPRPDAQFESRLNASSASGNPLPAFNRSQIEPVLGADLSGVRVHTGSEAAALSRSIDAQAFTFGNHIYFDSGKYDPGTSSGQELLAHEATHVVQQGMAPVAIQRRLNIPKSDWLPLIDIDSVVTSKSARTFEWHSRAERESASQFFSDRHGQPILQWLRANVTDKVELVRSFAWVMDGLDSFPHVDLALATIAGAVRVPPPAVLGESSLEGRAATRRHYEETFKLLSPRGNLEHDLLFFYGGPLVRDFQRSMALLHHNLTDAEELYFKGVGRESGGDVDALDVIKFIRDRWASGGFEALQQIDLDWANFVHMDRYWGWKYPAWSVHYFYNAVHYSIDSEKHRREIHPILTMFETMKDARKGNAEQTIEQDLENELLSAYWTVEASAKAGDEEQTREAMLLYHRIWRRFLAKQSVKDDPALLKRLQDRYEGRAAELPTGKVKGLSPLKKAILTPEDRLLELHGTSAAQFESFVTSAWLNDKPVFDLLVASNTVNPRNRLQARPMALSLPAVNAGGPTSQIEAKRAAALLVAGITDAERGYRRLLFEFDPAMGATRDIGSFRPDKDLEPVYKFLKTPGMTRELREEIIGEFATRLLGAKNQQEAVGVFLRQMYRRFEGVDGRWFLQILDLVDPDITTEERIERLKLQKDAGRSTFVGQVREGVDILRGEGRDLEGGVDASIRNVAAAKRQDLGFTLADEHGVPVGDKLESMLYGISGARIQEMHAREDEIAIMIAGAVEVGVEGLVGFMAGPAGWAQVIAAVVGNLAGQAAREGMLGTANSAITKANFKAVVMAGVGSYLFDVKDIRGTIAGLINTNTMPLLQKLKKFDKNGMNLSWRTQSLLQNVAAGIHDQGVALIVGTLMDPLLLNSSDPEQIKKDAAQAFARVIARPLHGAAYTFEVNPGSVTDSMKIGSKIKEMVGFKVAVKSSEKLGAELAGAAFADPDFTMNDAIHVTTVTMAKSLMGMAFKTVASSIASHQISQARSPLTEQWLRSAPESERHGVAGAVVEKDWALKQQFLKRSGALAAHEAEGQPWSEARRQAAGRWLETEGQHYDESGRLAHRQTAFDLEQAYTKAAKGKLGKVEENLEGRLDARRRRGDEAREKKIAVQEIESHIREDAGRARRDLADAVMSDPRLRIKYLQDVYGSRAQPGARVRSGDWALARIAAGDDLVIEGAAASLRAKRQPSALGGRAHTEADDPGLDLGVDGYVKRTNPHGDPHSHTKADGSGVTIHLVAEAGNITREGIHGLAAAGTVIVIAHGVEGRSALATGGQTYGTISPLHVAKLVREALPHGGRVLLFACESEEAAQSVQRVLGKEYEVHGSREKVYVPGAVKTAAGEPLMSDGTPLTGFASPLIRGRASLPESTGWVVPRVYPGTSFYTAGIREGDVVFEADHTRVKSIDDFLRIKSGKHGSVSVQVVRDGKAIYVDVK